MLVGEGQFLDLQIVMYAHEAVDIDAKGVGGQLGIEAGAQAPESEGMVGFDVELCGQLTVDSFDDLEERVVEAADRFSDLLLLVTPVAGEQTDAIVLPEVGCYICNDESLFADDQSVRILRQEFASDSRVKDAASSQLEVEDEAAPVVRRRSLQPKIVSFLEAILPIFAPQAAHSPRESGAKWN